MTKYILKRLLQSLITVLLVVTIVFLLLRLMPTDYYFTEDELMKLPDDVKEDRLRAAGLLDPPLVQLGRFYKQLLTQFDLGTSRRIQANQPVIKVIGNKLGISMHIGLIALGIALVLGVTFGVLQARFKDRLPDHIRVIHMMDGLPSAHLSFGDGILPLEKYYDEILDFGYQGKIVLEINDRRYLPDPHAALKQCIDRIRLWEDRP